MVRTLMVGLGIVVAALLAVGLTFSASVDAPAELRFVNGTEPKTLDPHLLTGQPGGRIVSALFEGLTRYDSHRLRPAPGVAERWEVSADGRTYVFHLRPDALWSDGRPVSAHDFAYSWRRLQQPSLGAEYAYLMHVVAYAESFHSDGQRARAIESEIVPALDRLAAEAPVSAERWRAFAAQQSLRERLRGTSSGLLGDLLDWQGGPIDSDGIRAVRQELEGEFIRRRQAHALAQQHFGVDRGVYARDDRTLVVELRSPTPYFLELTAFYPSYPVPRWRVEAPGHSRDWFLPETIVSNGAFQLSRWRVNDRMRLLRSDSYWGRSEVGLASVEILPIENATAALNLYLTGEVDWLPSLYPRDLAGALRGRSDFYVGPGLGIYYYRLNCRRPPFDDARVRRALALAIDRQVITREVTSLEMPAIHLVPPGMAGYRSPESSLAYDPEAARRLLAEAGYPGGRGFPDIGILYNTHEGHKKVAEVIADGLRRELGIRVSAYNQEWQSYLATIRAGDYDIARAGWIGDYEDPSTFLDLWVTGGGNNQTGWSHALYDRLINAASNVQRFASEGDSTLPGALAEPEPVRALLAQLREGDDPVQKRAVEERLRMQLFREAEAIIVSDEVPVIPIYYYVSTGLVSPEVEGFTLEIAASEPAAAPIANLQDRHPLRDLRMRTPRGGRSR